MAICRYSIDSLYKERALSLIERTKEHFKIIKACFLLFGNLSIENVQARDAIVDQELLRMVNYCLQLTQVWHDRDFID